MMWGRADKEERRAIDVRYNSDADKGVDYTSAMGGTLHRILSEKVRE